MRASELGEFGLIERLTRAGGVASDAASDARVIVGPGDDAAVWRAGDAFVVATTDTMVAGVHFLPERVSWEDVGWKAMASNVSDIAAMGGAPAIALVTLCIPGEMAVAALDGLYTGMRDCAARYGVTIGGGDIVAAPVFSVTVALAGQALAGAEGDPLLLRRNGARKGDAVAVTGPLGGSGGGLRVLLEGSPGGAAAEALVRRHMRPSPRTDAGRAAVEAGVRCGIDISDGLLQDLGHVCEASGAGAEIAIEQIPVDPSLAAVYGEEARTMAATSGEDYELVLVGDEAALAATSRALGAPLAIIGRMMAGEARVRVVDASGRDVTLGRGGWDHLKQG